MWPQLHILPQRVFAGAPAPAPPSESSGHNDLLILLPSILGAVLLTAAILGLGSWWYVRRHRKARKDLEATLQVGLLWRSLNMYDTTCIAPYPPQYKAGEDANTEDLMHQIAVAASGKDFVKVASWRDRKAQQAVGL